jgi:steroid delta-isomerase-like uncharacterized protein
MTPVQNADLAPLASVPLSRRVMLGSIGAGGFALALRSMAAAAQESTPAAAPPVVEAWLAAWSAPDPAAAVAALYTSDAIYEDVPSDTRSEPGQVEAFLRAFVDQISDIRMERRSAFGAGGWAASEWVFSFRYTGQFPGLPPGTGQPVSFHGATIFELSGDQIRRSSDYYDNVPLLAAVGLLPMPGTPVATPGS